MSKPMRRDMDLRRPGDFLGIVAAAVRRGFDQDELRVLVGETPVANAVAVLVELDRRDDTAVVRLPAIRLTVAVGVLFGAQETAEPVVTRRVVDIVMFPAIDPRFVAFRRDLHA